MGDERIIKVEDDSAPRFTIICKFFLHIQDTKTGIFKKYICMVYSRKMRQNSKQ